MATITYAKIKALAASLAGRPPNKLPTTEATMLRSFFASELPDLWNREAWPELCDKLEAVALDANNCFSTRDGAANEMGDILAILEGADPRTTTVNVQVVEGWTRLDGRVNVTSKEGSTTVYVDWQQPVPDLLAAAYDTESTLNALTLPNRFLLPLAWRGAALLLDEEDPRRAAQYRALAERDVALQAQRRECPWWRRK